MRSWGRWDSSGGRAIYTAESEPFAYLEVLAYIRPADSLSILPMAKAFPNSDDPCDQQRGSIMAQIRKEWEHKFARFGPGKNPLRWREARAIYGIALPAWGWFIDIGHKDTIAALNRTGGALGGPFHPTEPVTQANLFGEEREWTCRVATALRAVTLDDGNLPHGINFRSKHGNNGECWTVWLRQIDDGKEPGSEALRVMSAHEIGPTSKNPALKEAAKTFGLCLH